ncbi:MAG: hypothetical protein U9P14_09470 [Gemmatimonadota bacterium]|nr:hypothetical protein [Gemmatimonadota bacterium]
MCKYCDVNSLTSINFDSFFEGACAQGFRSMICKHCSRTFLTDFVFLAGQPPENQAAVSVTPAEENSYVQLPVTRSA